MARANNIYLDEIPQLSVVAVSRNDDHGGDMSTVMPGSTGGPIRQALEGSSGRAVGVDLGLCYNPEFIALGSVIRDM